MNKHLILAVLLLTATPAFAANSALFVNNGTTSTANGVTVTGGTTGVAPSIAAAGSDTNVNLVIAPQGTGAVSIGTTSAGSEFNVNGGVSIGTGYVGTAAPANGVIVQGGVGVGTSAPTAGTALDLGSNTNSLLLPSGSTGQRPTGVNGMIRYNSTTPAVEAYEGGVWSTLGIGTALPNGTTATTQAVDTSNTTVATTAFANPASSLSTNGYVQLPSGLYIEWGSVSAFTGSQSVSLPIAFPNNAFSVVITANNDTSGDQSTDYAVFTSLSAFTIGNKNTNARSYYWQAIGN